MPAPTTCSVASRVVFHSLVVSLVYVLGACGGAAPAFSTRFADNRASDIDQLLKRLDAAATEPAPPIIAGVTAAPTRLYAFDLQAQRVLWNVTSNVRHAPILAGNYVVTQETGGIVGRDLSTGDERFVIADEGMILNGAAASGTTLALVLTRGNGAFAESVVTLIERNSVQWERALKFTAGSPAVIGDVVLVPWGTQSITALDARTGDEFARVRVTDTVVGHVFVDRGHVFAAGQHGFFALTSKVQSGRAHDAAYFAHQERDLPGRPRLIRDAYALSPMPAADSAEQRIRLSWQPTLNGDQVGLEDSHLYLSFYRFVFALDATGASAAWVYKHDADVVGSAAQPGGVLLADDAGGVTLVSAVDGRKLWHASSNLPSTVVSFPTNAVAISANAEEEPAVPVRDQLVTAAQDQDARLVPARALAVEMLGALEDPEATASLIDLCANMRLTPPVRVAACNALSKRTQGSEQILAALGRHAAFLEGTTAPPIGALAKAAVAARVQGAAGALIGHLADPNTASTDLPALVTALNELNDASAAQPLSDFLRLYHADADDDEHLINALKIAIDTLSKLSGPGAIEVLTEISSDPLSVAALRQHAATVLSGLEAQAEAAQAQAAEGDEDAAEGEEDAQAPAETPAAEPARPSGPPPRMTLGIVEQTLTPVRQQLRACLKVGERQYYSARVVLVIEDSSLLTVAVVPQATQACIEPIIRAQRFPATISSKRERIDYTLNYR